MLLIFFGTEYHVELLLHCDYVLYFDMLFHKILLVSVVPDISACRQCITLDKMKSQCSVLQCWYVKNNKSENNT
jgi:hypothetical protein